MVRIFGRIPDALRSKIKAYRESRRFLFLSRLISGSFIFMLDFSEASCAKSTSATTGISSAAFCGLTFSMESPRKAGFLQNLSIIIEPGAVFAPMKSAQNFRVKMRLPMTGIISSLSRLTLILRMPLVEGSKMVKSREASISRPAIKAASYILPLIYGISFSGISLFC